MAGETAGVPGIHNPDIEAIDIESENQGNVSLIGVMTEFSIFENINNNYTVLEIEMHEYKNLIELLPIKGGEKLDVKFRSSEHFSEPYEYEFIVYKVSDVQTEKQKGKKYTIHAISPIFFEDKKFRLSRRFEDKPHNIVENICTNLLNVELEKETSTKFDQNIVIPNWTPLQTINYMTRVSLQSDDSSSMFFFFQSRDKFYYRSLGDLFGQDVPSKKIFKSMITVDNYSKQRYDIIKDFSIIKDHDVFENFFNGVFGSKLYRYNLIDKKYFNGEETERLHEDMVSQTKSLNANPFENDLEKSANQFVSFETENYNNKHIKNWYQIFMHELGKVRTAQKLNVTLVGNSNITVGDVVRLELPSTRNINNPVLDPYLTGNYLVTKVRHQVAKEIYTTVMEVIKESNE